MRRVLGAVGVMILLCGPVRPAAAARRAVLVAVAAYPGQRTLPGPREMQQQFRDLLLTHGGFSADEIVTLTDSQATHDAIVTTVQQSLIDTLRPGDVGVFYFAGHGGDVVDEDDHHHGCLCPFDAQDNPLLEEELSALLGQVRTDSLSVFLDCCHSGVVTRSVGDEPLVPLFMPLTQRVPTPPPARLVLSDVRYLVMSACRNDQSAVAVRNPQKGNFLVFTRALVESLSGTEPLPSYQALLADVRQRVRQWGYIYPGEHEPQEPQLVGPEPDRTVFTPARGAAAAPPAPTLAEPAPRLSLPVIRVRLGGPAAAGVRAVIGDVSWLRWVGPTDAADLVVDAQLGRVRLSETAGQTLAQGEAAAVAAVLAREALLRQAAALANPLAPLPLSLSDPTGGGPTYRPGQPLGLQVEAPAAVSLLVFEVGADGKLTIDHPSGLHPTAQVAAGEPLRFPDPALGVVFTTGPETGGQVAVAVATREPLELPELRTDDLGGRPYRRLSTQEGLAFLARLAAALEGQTGWAAAVRKTVVVP